MHQVKVNRGIYNLGKWVAGMRFLPPPVDIPKYFQILGFTIIPDSAEEVKNRFRSMSKSLHPDKPGGSAADFNNLKVASEKAISYMNKLEKERK